MKIHRFISIDPKAYSADHFLIHQGLLNDVPYGHLMSSQNGCGWIAAYNYLKASGYSISAESSHHKFEKLLPFHGRIGTHIFILYFFLLSYTKKPLRLSMHTKKEAGKCYVPHSGILMYHTGKGFHYVSFLHQSKDQYRFFNAIYGKEHDVRTLKEFLKAQCALPFVFLIW